MKIALLLFALVSCTAAIDLWGPSWSFGPSTSRIIYAKTTMIPGHVPPITTSSGTGPLFLWPGMSNGTGDLIQATMEMWPSNGWCGAVVGYQWCVRASVFGWFGQRDGPAAAVDPDDRVTIEYTLQPNQLTWHQVVTSAKLGRVVSTLDSDSGPMMRTGFGFGTECDANSYTIDNHYYINTMLRFASADPHFASTGVGGAGGTATNVRTPDGGLTWLVDLITLPAMKPSGQQTPPPSIAATCAQVNEDTAATVTCSSGTIRTINFASYGTPTGSCTSGFATSSCHSSNSTSIVQSACVGKSSCTVQANNALFGDPCWGVYKSLAISVTCA